MIRRDKSKDLLRQKNLAKLIGEKGRKMPMGKLMIEAGYKKGYAQHPKQLKKTKNWQELMEQYIPDSLLAEKHQALLNKKDKKTGEIDDDAVAKGLDMGYKVKGKYAPDKHEFGEIVVRHIR